MLGIMLITNDLNTIVNEAFCICKISAAPVVLPGSCHGCATDASSVVMVVVTTNRCLLL